MIITPGVSGLSGNRFNTAVGAIDPASSKYEETQLTKYLRATFGTHKGPMDRAREASATPSMASSRASSIIAGYESSANSGVPIFGIQRRYFEHEGGMNFCTELILQDEETVMTM